jgi:hypothetical protein
LLLPFFVFSFRLIATNPIHRLLNSPTTIKKAGAVGGSPSTGLVLTREAKPFPQV